MNMIAKKLLFVLLLAPLLAFAEEGPALDKAPDRSGDQAALQHGAKVFVTYCLNCHGASSMRYNRLEDIGFTPAQIKAELLPADGKVGDLMAVASRREDAKKWFGAAPPDLSVIARARGADYLYTYLRGFYRDEARPTSWNNTVFPAVGMPHVLWELQGEQVQEADGKLKLVKPGKLSPAEYDATVADLVGYLVFMGEPVAGFRKELGVGVLIALAVLFVFAYALKKEYWKDVH
jgi:ubiquinol-cytochrome c reductase cytochrome c1 subunit